MDTIDKIVMFIARLVALVIIASAAGILVLFLAFAIYHKL